MGTSWASGATPTTPTLFSGAAAVPATWVPCPWPSLGGSDELTQFSPVEVSMLAARSGWSRSIPVSMTAIRVPAPRKPALYASPPPTTNAPIRAMPNGSVSVSWTAWSRVTDRTRALRRRAAAAAAEPFIWNPLIAWV